MGQESQLYMYCLQKVQLHLVGKKVLQVHVRQEQGGKPQGVRLTGKKEIWED